MTHILSLPLTPGPCDPVNVTSVLQCGSNMATVSWEAAAGAVAYTVFAQEDSSQHYTSCRSSTASCQLNQLQCGKVYNLTVMAEDATCNSTGNISAILMTGRKEDKLDRLKSKRRLIFMSSETHLTLLLLFLPLSPLLSLYPE